jgi:hypothetical protein
VAVRFRNRRAVNAATATVHVEPSNPQKRCACEAVRASPGISRYFGFDAINRLLHLGRQSGLDFDHAILPLTSSARWMFAVGKGKHRATTTRESCGHVTITGGATKTRAFQNETRPSF